MPEKRTLSIYIAKETPNSPITHQLFFSITVIWNVIMQGEKSAFIFIFEPYVEIQNVFGFSIVADPILKKDSFFLSIIIYAENKSPNLLSTILIPPYSTVELKQEILQQCLGKKIWDSVFLECAGSNENNVLGFPIDFDYIKEEVLQKSP